MVAMEHTSLTRWVSRISFLAVFGWQCYELVERYAWWVLPAELIGGSLAALICFQLLFWFYSRRV